MSVGISRGIFVVGLIAAVIGSVVLSAAVTMQWAKGPQGDKGDIGETGPQGIQGPQGQPGLYVADYDSGWINITDKTGQYFNITHGLNSTDIIVDVTGKTTLDGGVHQRNLGGTDYVLDRGRTYVPGSARSLVKTSDGGYVIAGYTASGTSGVDFQMVKTDPSWNTQWSKSYAREGASDDLANCVFQTSDGGYALAGIAGSNDFWLVKTDSTGTAQWNKTYGGINTEEARSVVQTSDGGCTLVGYTDSYGAGSTDFWLVKTDSAGTALWNKTYGGVGSDIATSLVQTNDGGYALAGYTNSFGEGNYDSFLVKTDSNGNMAWNKTYGGTNWDSTHSLVQTIDGGYALAGDTRSFGADAPAHTYLWVVKTNSAGKPEWVQDSFKYGLAWTESTNNVITLYRGASDVYWNYVRVRIWKTKTP